jgi:glycosyltransferase involved in cell wall biosynthesis
VYCSSKSYPDKSPTYLSAQLKYIPLNANGAQSIVYDWISLFLAMWRADVILLLGVSGATMLPLVRLFSSAKIVTNIDGIEWRRQKWKGLAKWFLKFSEKVAVRFSHEVIADNGAIAAYVKETYGVDAHVIAYGGDHALSVEPVSVDELELPKKYAFSVCRIEPENNVHMIIEAFAEQTELPLIIVGNWDSSEYGKTLRGKYAELAHIHLLNPIYDLGKLHTLRSNASLYVHGHSAGGTNPSLVEAMHFGVPILAYDCNFNRFTTEGGALYFKTKGELTNLIKDTRLDIYERIGSDMLKSAQQRYTWDIVAQQYFSLISTRTRK